VGEFHEHQKRKAKKNKTLLFFGLTNLIWLLFRSGTKPSRIVYPCQRTALSNVSLSLCLSIPFAFTTFVGRTEKTIVKRAKTLIVLYLACTLAVNVGQFLVSSAQTAKSNSIQEFRLQIEPKNATIQPASDIFLVNGHSSNPVNELISLMASHGMLFYESNVQGENSGPDGLVARDDVILIKINEQWSQRGGTNTDILKNIIQAIINHPDGFVGEIVVADNGQGYGTMNWQENNAENISQSTQAVVDLFSSSYKVSTYDWQPIRGTRVDEYLAGDNRSGYICYQNEDPQTGIYVSYPKFQTKYGTYVSFKYGIWNGTGYEQRLKVINVPVLKTHGTYGVTGCLKAYMGVQSEGQAVDGGLANGHDSIVFGGMGTLIAQTRFPTLNILDATWINARPNFGPETAYTVATRVNILMASTDPAALDHFASKHVLMQTSLMLGYSNASVLYMDPDDTGSGGFHIYLMRTKNILAASGFNVTINENQMNVFVKQGPQSLFSFTPSIPKVNETIVFDASETRRGDSDIFSYRWDFGDGTQSSENVTTHTYTSSGYYNVTLNVTDSAGFWDLQPTQVQIVQPHGPTARFSVNPTTTNINVSVKFDASNSTPGSNGTSDMPITEYRWTFGDGNDTTTSTSVIYHSYIEEGLFNSTLTVYSQGATPELDISTAQYVNITSSPNGNNSTVPEYPSVEGTVLFISMLTTGLLIAVSRMEIFRRKKREAHVSETSVIQTTSRRNYSRWK
jgi:PKD repeat protein